MNKLTQEQKNEVASAVGRILGVDSIIIVHGNSKEGKIGTIMSVANDEIDLVSFGEGGISQIQDLIRDIDRKQNKSRIITE